MPEKVTDFRRMRLFAPGPNPVAAPVMAALGSPVDFHRDEEYSLALEETTDHLRAILGADRSADVFATVSTGTGGVECALANLCAPGDPVVIAVQGQFSIRMAALARRRGLVVTEVHADWGKPIEADKVADAARRVSARVIGLVHHETSTGIVNDPAALRDCCADLEACILLDAVSSAGALCVDMTGWGVDVVVASSQKGLRVSPGLAILAISEKAWAAKESVDSDDTFYFDWNRMKAEFQRSRPESIWTPAVSLMRALHTSTSMMMSHGLDRIFAETAALSRGVRAGLEGAGFATQAGAEDHEAPVVVRRPPDGVVTAELIGMLRDRFGVRVVDGQGPWKGQVIRMSVFGAIELFDMLGLVAASDLAVRELTGRTPGQDVLGMAWRGYNDRKVAIAGGRNGVRID